MRKNAHMHHRVASQRGVVGLDVELEMLHQVVLPQEVEAGSRVAVVLVLRRLFRLGLDQERPLEADLLRVIDRHDRAAHIALFA